MDSKARLVKVTKNSKAVGPGCSFTLDLERGCINQCIGCYAKEFYLSGPKEHFYKPEEFILDEDKLRKNLLNFQKNHKGKWVRTGVNCDPARKPKKLIKLLNLCAETNTNIIVISKSIKKDEELAKALKCSQAILHVSLGMLTKAQPDNARYRVGQFYAKRGVKVIYRIVADVTKKPSAFYKKAMRANYNKILLTPLRLRSYEQIKLYDINLNGSVENFTFHKGYYKPQFINSEWANPPVCGEIAPNGKAKRYCVKCFTDT